MKLIKVKNFKSFDDKDVDEIIFKVFFESKNNDGENIEV